MHEDIDIGRSVVRPGLRIVVSEIEKETPNFEPSGPLTGREIPEMESRT